MTAVILAPSRFIVGSHRPTGLSPKSSTTIPKYGTALISDCISTHHTDQLHNIARIYQLIFLVVLIRHVRPTQYTLVSYVTYSLLCRSTAEALITKSLKANLTNPNGTHRYERSPNDRMFMLPENFRTLRRKDIPVTYRLHDDLLRYYRKGTRPVTHPSKVISVSMSVFLYQIINLVSHQCNALHVQLIISKVIIKQSTEQCLD
ncbi:hypothetical protein AB6A40_009510 [Gnathostoma spinigerum]|uniref:Uncharacterized protein n=1 Tax=Gnathostoma spinigerum TaxID=75299 RepID=A0ABD6EU02_9BILA